MGSRAGASKAGAANGQAPVARRQPQARSPELIRFPPGGTVAAPAPASALLGLRAVIGNRQVTSLLGAQARLEVGPSTDPLEQEAERVSAEVVRRLPERTPPTDRVEPGAVGPEGGAVDRVTEDSVRAQQGRGRQLDPVVRRDMEGAFGVDFGHVRLHAGPTAGVLNRAVGAQAFTVGSDIFFGRGAPDATRPAGQALLAHELTHTIQQGAAAPIRRTGQPGVKGRSRPAVQRLVDRAGLEAKAGRARGNIGFKKMSVQYKALLSGLDAYHAKSNELWTANVTGPAYGAALEPLLDAVGTSAWAYIGEREDSDRTPHLRDLVSREIPAERRRLKAVATSSDFATMDRATPVADVGAGSPAKVVDSGIDVGYDTVVDQAEGGTAQSHSMALWFELDAGDRPARHADDPPDSIYGVTLEYWEEVKLDYNFVEPDKAKASRLKRKGEGASYKQWNDIKVLAPDSATFGKVGGQIELSWQDAVRRAATLQLRGRKKIGFTDKPGVTPIAGKHIRRTLNFRIVAKDGANRREIFATQVIECDGDKDMPLSMTYVDSLGNALGRTRPTKGAPMVDMAADDDRLVGGLDVTAGAVSRAVPPRARAGIRPFVEALVANTAPAFANLELIAVQAKFPDAPDVSGPYKAYGRLGKKKYNTESDFYEIAGMNTAPYPQPGLSYFQHPLKGTALLMAVMRNDQLLRMYHTDGKSREVGAKQVRVRSFGEIPLEEAQAYVGRERGLAATTAAERRDIGVSKAVRGLEVAAIETAVSNARKNPKTSGRVVRELLESNPREYERIEKLYDTGRGGVDSMGAMLRRYFASRLKNQTLDAALYEQLVKPFPHERARAELGRAWSAALKKADPTKSDDQRATTLATVVTASRGIVGTAPGLEQAVRNANGDAGVLESLVMAYAENHPAEQASLEKVYNSTIPALALPGAPAALGPLITGYFEDQFKTSGSLSTFTRLTGTYPGLEYRLRPAYRQVHGDKELSKVLDRRRAVEDAVDFPDPGSAANLGAKAAFLAHGPFTQNNFASTIAKEAKFDVRYEPTTGQIMVTVKLSFNFVDSMDTPVKVKGKEVGAQYGRTGWTDESKARYKADFRSAIRETWGANPPLIRCTRPGWEDIVARPVFEIVEVPRNQAHNPVNVRKTVLGDNNGAKKLKTINAGWGGVESTFNETDVADKISDPAVHRYLHTLERTANIDPAFETDRRQLVRRLQDYGTLRFVAGSSTLVQPNRVQVLAGEIARLKTAVHLAPLHKLEVAAPTVGGTDAARLQLVAGGLATAGVTNPVAKVADPTLGADTVVVRAATSDPTVKDIYSAKWSRLTVAHEFGHMLGLMDEYYGAKSGEVVKQMISDGLLPTDTRADHLIANPPQAAQQEAEGQEATARLLTQAELSGADYTLGDGAKSSSLMTGGNEMWPQHYLTVWEALCRVTAADLGVRFWKLG